MSLECDINNNNALRGTQNLFVDSGGSALHVYLRSCFGFVSQLAFCVQVGDCGDEKQQSGFRCNRRTGGETGGEQVDEWAGLCTLLLL